MIDRKQFADELVLREAVRKAIKVVGRKRERRHLREVHNEEKLRAVIRSLVEAQSAVAAVAKHASTGINALEDVLKKSIDFHRFS